MKAKEILDEVVEAEGEIKIQPRLGKVYFMEFYWNNKRIGGIEMKGKKLHFEGDADKSAKLLFDKLIDFVELYIYDELLKKDN